jgi:alpha/beta superfamily hydrolase
MHNKVVHRIARGLRSARAVVLRFNFRGVNLSEGIYDKGEGELDDARAALHYLRERYPALPLTLAGFSFGSRVALRLACGGTGSGARRVIAVGFPAAYKDNSDLGGCTLPRIFVQSTHDEFGPLAEIEPVVAALPEPKRLILVEARDHFFSDALDRFEQEIQKIG